MATYNRPGVYVNELPLPTVPANGAAAATAAGAVIAAFPQGPDTVTRVTSWYDFSKKFGGYSKAYPATFSVGSFFKNGGTELYVKRVLPAAAQKVAKLNLPSAPVAGAQVSITHAELTSNVATFTAVGHGIDSTVTSITVAGMVNTTYNGTWTVTSFTTDLVSVALVDDDIVGADVSAGTIDFYKHPVVATIAAKHRGIDGNNIRIEVQNSKAVREDGYYDLTVLYEAGVGDYVGGVFTQGNSLDDIIVEQFNGVVFNDPTSGDYIVSVLEFGSSYVRVLEGTVTEYDSNGDVITNNPNNPYVVNGTLDPVVDTVFPLSGAPTPEVNLTYGDYTGNYYVAASGGNAASGYDPFTNEGTLVVDDCKNLLEFEAIDQPLVFFLPDVTTKISGAATGEDLAGWSLSKFVYNTVIDWIETPRNNGRHYLVVETPADLTVDESLTHSGDLTKTSRAAVYYPHVFIKDPLGRSGSSVRKLGPSGAVTGLFLETDRRVGPFKTPAGIDTKVTDAIAIERAFSPAELDALNSGVTTTGNANTANVVNAIRNLPGAGIVVMGGRTLKQDGTANRYVNMRRSLTYLEKRFNDIASFAVFENNTEVLWGRLITQLGAFLNEYRNQGGLRGTTVEESFYIKCDEENNTAASIAAGEVHVEIGVALEYPAEFVIINLSQKTAE